MCWNQLLSTFDSAWHHRLSKILNVDLNDSQWTQVTLPVHMGGLEVRSAFMLAPSAFLAFSAAMLSLQEAILPEPLCHTDDRAVSYALSVLKTQTSNAEPSNTMKHYQRAWDNLVRISTFMDLLSTCSIPLPPFYHQSHTTRYYFQSQTKPHP